VGDDGTKYGDRIADHEWSEPRRDDGADERAELCSGGVSVEIVHVHDPDATHPGEGRHKYELHASPPAAGPTDTWTVAFARRYRDEAGQFWKRDGAVDWADLPGEVKAEAARVLPVDSPSALDPGKRLVDWEGVGRR
jgi:hypothetical protein